MKLILVSTVVMLIFWAVGGDDVTDVGTKQP